MTFKRRNRMNWISGLVLGLLAFPHCVRARVQPRRRTKREVAHRREARKHTAPEARRRTPYRRRAVRKRHETRRHSYRRHELAHWRSIHLSSDRVKEIQGALINTGYLKSPADGHWGPETSQAMKAFQKANGFDPTGLPEAKALMKLGLGPHPLPPAMGARAADSSKPASSAGATPSSSSADAGNTDPRDR